MKHFKKILATTDLSSESLSTVRYALHLAKGQNASVVLLHVPPLPEMFYPEALVPIDLYAVSEEIERAALESLKRWTKRYAKDSSIRTMVRRGIVHETIAAVAKEVGADLIVMSTHGRKGVSHVVLGSVTERVLRDAPCPVLVVRPPHASKAARVTRPASAKKAA